MDLSSATWQKSSHSTGDGGYGDCVEVAFVPGTVAVRDSKSPASGTLAFTAETWRHISEIAR